MLVFITKKYLSKGDETRRLMRRDINAAEYQIEHILAYGQLFVTMKNANI